MKNINVTIHFTGLVDIRNIHSGATISLSEGATLGTLLSKLGIVEQHKRYITAMINGNIENLSHVLHDSDEVKLFLPVGGG